MTNDKENVIVIFRKHTGKFNSVVAVFPAMVFNHEPWLCGCYEHVGQHGAFSKDYYPETKPATESEYAPLKKELENIGYDLNIVKRWTNKFDVQRRESMQRS